MKKFVIILIFVLILAIGSFMYISNYMESSLSPVDINDTTLITVEIPSGSNTTTIANILYEKKLINNVNSFKYLAKKDGYDVLLKAGEFTLSKSMSAKEILDNLVNKSHSNNTINLTIIEGLTLEDTAKSISEQLSLDEGKLLELMKDADKSRASHEFLKDNEDIKDLQGYLLPETYNLYVGMTEEDIIDFLLTQFDKYYENTILSALKNTTLNFEEVIILASIVEKEAMLKEEKPIISGVFINRLEIDMKLQSCATVNYAQGEWKARLSEQDILIDSPYNTYINVGLPPSPINSPGKDSINAVLHPEKVDYLYFLAKGDGSHYFSVTYDEHLKAKENYID
ncbi:endolytic transglycosylase MltG [Sedimentibacter sp. zth1]|uniref:endolytic transglycosylase MltG n=1 Tax=Sedimentibacter sp. zth1 TaxID=2816908 RepID=UPI001A921A45|nr:endolytic transglycosylase MltG [Sedimentibacter sp. zth1]QSX06440.1 endolytic transglycosylase MltG [Sedimentibacter sp. zth1]